MANKLTDKKREQMFEAWCVKQSCRHVAQKCSVSPQTTKRYRKKDKWDSRYAKINQKTAEKVDNSIIKMRARHAKYGQVLQQMFHNSFLKDGKLDMDAVKKLNKKELIKALEAGVKIEREAVGETEKLELVMTDYEKKSEDELRALLNELEIQEKKLKKQ